MPITQTRQIRLSDPANCALPRATAWRVLASSQFCVTANGYNTGQKGWATLEQYYTDDNAATGQQKPNTNGQADYRAPVTDQVTCPVPIRGCTDPTATNYNPDATVDDGSCNFGCPPVGPQPQTPCAQGWTLGFEMGASCPSWICPPPNGGGLQ